MHKRILFFLYLLLPLLFCGCTAIGDKSASLVSVYGVTAFLALVILVGYCAIVKKKDLWFLLLLSSVLVVNIGYFALAISTSLEEALLANRLAYLGSVFLPLSMMIIILNVSGISYRKWLPSLLFGISVLVFLVAASPGYLDVYYKEVTFAKINGVTVLHKVYGPLHGLYLLYLLGYFYAMVSAILYAWINKKLQTIGYAVIVALAVFLNIGVWLIEQLVQLDFEILSVSYIISESFLLGLHLFMADLERQKEQFMQSTAPQPEIPQETAENPTAANDCPVPDAHLQLFLSGLSRLTPKEQALYDCYVAGMSTAEIMEALCIKENTLKFHNKNLYSKLGVSSRKQLLELHKISVS